MSDLEQSNEDEKGIYFTFITHKVHPVFSQPVEALKEEQEGEEGDKAGWEVIPKDSEC